MANMCSTTQQAPAREVFPSTPFLGISDRGTIVLFTCVDGNYGHGVVISVGTGPAARPLGYYSTEWGLRHFKPYRGSVTVTTDY